MAQSFFLALIVQELKGTGLMINCFVPGAMLLFYSFKKTRSIVAWLKRRLRDNCTETFDKESSKKQLH